MCGFIAAYSPKGEPVWSDQWPNILSHRGPDNTEVVRQKDVNLVHNRLSIVDINGGSQPFVSDDHSVYCVANAEIYNHNELRKMLSTEYGYEFKSKSDCEVILALYLTFGPEKIVEIAKHLDAMFAFTIVDRRRKIVCAGVDSFSIKPLYVAVDKSDGSVYTASELKALTNWPESIFKLSAGHVWTSEMAESVAFETLSVDTHQGPFITDAELAKTRIRASLKKAIEKRLMADVEVGLLLSGGIDSSIVAVLMREIVGPDHPIKSFTVGREGSKDLMSARVMAEIIGSDHHEALLDNVDPSQYLEEIIYHAELTETEVLRSCIPNYFLAKLTSQHVKVVITGEGSDELFAGYLHYRDCPDEQSFIAEQKRMRSFLQYKNNQRVDRMSMRWSLEARVPFLDKELVRLTLGIDPKLLMPKNGLEKHLLREAFKDEIPKEILYRPKAQQCEGVGHGWVQDLVSAFGQEKDHSGINEAEHFLRVFQKLFPKMPDLSPLWPGGYRTAGCGWEDKYYSASGLKNVSHIDTNPHL